MTLSIVGIDQSPDYGYYVAKLAQERAAREAHAAPLVLRATQFHDFARQMFEWNRDGDVTRVMDVPTQPVDTAEIVRVLLDLATGAVTTTSSWPVRTPERLVDLVERYAAHVGSDVQVVAGRRPGERHGRRDAARERRRPAPWHRLGHLAGPAARAGIVATGLRRSAAGGRAG